MTKKFSNSSSDEKSQVYDEMGMNALPNSDHPLLEQISKYREEVKNLDKQRRRAAKQFSLERENLQTRIADLVIFPLHFLPSQTLM
jgi:hypothetical protein